LTAISSNLEWWETALFANRHEIIDGLFEIWQHSTGVWAFLCALRKYMVAASMTGYPALSLYILSSRTLGSNDRHGQFRVLRETPEYTSGMNAQTFCLTFRARHVCGA
jgi:hypothetical protein